MIGKPVRRGIVDYGRDAVGLATTGVLTGSIREVGAIIGFFVSPRIAGTSFGKDFNKGFALLCLVDSLLERFVGGKGAI